MFSELTGIQCIHRLQIAERPPGMGVSCELNKQSWKSAAEVQPSVTWSLGTCLRQAPSGSLLLRLVCAMSHDTPLTRPEDCSRAMFVSNRPDESGH